MDDENGHADALKFCNENVEANQTTPSQSCRHLFPRCRIAGGTIPQAEPRRRRHALQGSVGVTGLRFTNETGQMRLEKCFLFV